MYSLEVRSNGRVKVAKEPICFCWVSVLRLLTFVSQPNHVRLVASFMELETLNPTSEPLGRAGSQMCSTAMVTFRKSAPGDQLRGDWELLWTRLGRIRRRFLLLD